MTYHAYTTLNEIRKHRPCKDGWDKLLKHLGKTKADDEPLHLLTILESNGFDDALWCLQAKSLERLSRHFQAWCAEQVLHHFETEYPHDTRIREQIAMLRNDDATQEEREAARAAAWAAAWEPAWKAAWAAAKEAAWEAAKEAANAAGVAAEAAARGAAWATASVPAYTTAYDAVRDAQEAQLRTMIGATQ